MADIYYRDRNKGKYDKNGNKLKPNWQYRFEAASIGGKRKEIQESGFRTKAEAVAAGTKAYDEYMNAGTKFVPVEMSFGDCVDYWYENYVKMELAEMTQENYEKRIRLHIKPRLGHYRLQALDTSAIQRFVNELTKENYSRNSVNSDLGIISSVLKYAKLNKWVRYNEAADVSVPQRKGRSEQRKKERKPISRDTIGKIFERFPEKHSCHIPLKFGYRLGVRWGEAFGFFWDDIDFDKGIIKINRQIQWIREEKKWKFMPPKYDSYREIDVDPELLRLLKRERTRQKEGQLYYGECFQHLYMDSQGYLNTEKSGKEILPITRRPDGTYIAPRVMQHCSRVIHLDMKIEDFDFHSLRHTHATELAERGVNIKEIQRRLGHKTLEITQDIYTHASDLMREEAIKKLANMYSE